MFRQQHVWASVSDGELPASFRTLQVAFHNFNLRSIKQRQSLIKNNIFNNMCFMESNAYCPSIEKKTIHLN